MTKSKKIPFENLSKDDQRRTLAKDCLAQIEAKEFKIDTRSYINVRVNEKFLKANIGKQVNKIIPELKCEVCAKGALFLSHINRFNDCKIADESEHFLAGIDELQNDDETAPIYKRLRGIFSALQLDMIETAFEQRVCEDSTKKLSLYYNDGWRDPYPSRLGQKCRDFSKLENPTQRLKEILENIIINGKFKP